MEHVHVNPWFQVTRSRRDGLDWYRVHRADSAMLIGTDGDNRILMLLGTRDTIGDELLYEFPCGAIEVDETPADAARRETAEESGYSASNLAELGSFVEAPGISPAVCHVFTATLSAGRQEPQLEPGEAWRPTFVDAQHLHALVTKGRIRDAGTLSTIALRAAHATDT